MSNQVDNYVASMEFDNSKFEKNVATSMSTLEKLKQKLNLSGASKGLEDINSAAGKVNMSGLGGAVESVTAKFSAMDVVAITALTNITNKVINAGEQLVKSLSIDQVTAGWQKFSEMTTSSATLIAQGNAVEDVNEQLDQLLYYTDETSYNFTDMVSNIAKFTATGKDLEESVTAMEGIANWAALSGQNATTASRAMYQLSQAMGAGVMRLEDYRSIQNASMDTEEFRQKCIDAAIALGTLKDNGDGTYSSLVEGAGKTSFSISQFTTQLTEGMWLTSDVMMEVFNTYSSAVGAILDRADETDRVVSEVIDEIHDKADELKTDTMSDTEAIDAAIRELGYTLEDGSLMFDSFGLKALEAAQKARTFRDAVDATKDAVSSQWMKTFQLIFGDANQATELWTDVSEQLWNIFASGGESRNGILSSVMMSKWDQLVEKVEEAGASAEDFESAIKEAAKESGIAIDELIAKHGSLGEAIMSGEVPTNIVTTALKKLVGVTDTYTGANTELYESLKKTNTYTVQTGDCLWKIAEQYGTTWQELYKLNSEIINNPDLIYTGQVLTLTSALGEQAEQLSELSDEQLENMGYTEDQVKALRELAKQAEETGTPINELIESLNKPSGQELIFDIISNSLAAVSKVIETFREAWGEIFTEERTAEALYNALYKLQQFSVKVLDFLDDNADELKRTFKGLAAAFDIVGKVVGGTLKAAFTVLNTLLGNVDFNILNLTANIGDAIVSFNEWLDSSTVAATILEGLKKAAEAVGKVISTISTAVQKWFAAFKESDGMQATIQYIRDLCTEVKEWWASLEDSEDLPKTIAEGIVNAFSSIPSILETIGSNIWEALVSSFSGFDDSPLSGYIEKIRHYGDIAVQVVTELGKLLLEKLNGFLSAHGFREISEDSIAGLVNGLKDGAYKVWEAGVELASELVQKVKDFLGIQSPSTVFAAIGGFIIAGLIMGLQNGIPDSLGALKDVFQPMLDWLGSIDFSKIFAGALGAGTVASIGLVSYGIYRIGDAVGSLGDIAQAVRNNVGKVMGGFAKVEKSFARTLNATAVKLVAEAVLTFAEAIAVLAAAVVALSLACDEDNKAAMYRAVGIIVILAGVLAGLALAMNKFGSSALSINKSSGANINGSMLNIIAIAGAVLIMAMALKSLAKLNMGELIQGGVAVAALAGIIVGLMAATKLISTGANVDTVGGTLLKIALAIGAMALVVKLLGGMDTTELIQGELAVAALAGIIVGLMAATKLISTGANVDTIGGTLFKIAAAIGVMALVVIALSFITLEDIIKGTAAITAFAGIMVGLMAATKLAVGVDGDKLGKALLSIAGAIAILAGLVIILGLIPNDVLIKGGIVVTLLAGMMVGLMAATKLASSSKSSILVLLIMMAGMAALILLLSDIKNTDGAIKSAVALGALVLAMSVALVILSKISKENIGSIVVGVVALAALGLVLREFVWVLASMAGLENARENAITLAILAGACSVMLVVLAVAGSFAWGAIIGVAALAALGLVLREFIWVLASMQGLENARENTDILLTLLTGCVKMLAVLTVLGVFAIAGILGVVSLAALGLVLAEFVWVLSLMEGLENADANVTLIDRLLTVLTRVLTQLAIIGPMALIGVVAMDGLVLLIGAIAVMATAIGALMEKFPQLQTFLDTGLPILEQIAGSIGTMIGLFVGNMITEISSVLCEQLPKLGTALSEFMINATPFITLCKMVDGSLLEQVGILTAAILLLTVADFIAGAAQFLNGGLSFADLGQQLMIFGASAMAFSAMIKSIDASAVEAANNVVNMILALVATDVISKIAEKFCGSIDFDSMGETLQTFGEAVVDFSNTISGKVDVAAVEAAANAGALLVKLNESLPRSDGWIQDIIGEQDFEKFAEGCKSFAECILDINETVSQEGFELQSEKIDQLVAAGTAFSDLNNAIPRSDGWLQDIIGKQDLEKFGESVKAFAETIIELSETLSDEKLVIQEDKLGQLATAGTKFSELNQAIPKSGGWLQKVVGEEDLTKFGDTVEHFATCLITVNEALSAEGFAVNLDAMEDLKQAGLKMNEMQESLPKSGGWWQDITGSEDLGAFGESIDAFATSIVDFSTSAEGLNVTAIDTALTAAKDLKDFFTLLKDVDYSGVVNFTGVGTGAAGADGPPYDLALAIAKFSDTISGIDTEAVPVAIIAANDLKDLINSLVGLDTSGIENFTPEGIGDAMKTYNDKVKDIDTGTISESIDNARKLKAFISGLTTFDSSVASNFNAEDIGSALKTYNSYAADLDTVKIDSSITTATDLKTFVTGLVNLDTSGISLFASAIEELSSIDTSSIAEAFGTAGTDAINGFVNALQTGAATIEPSMDTIMTAMTGKLTAAQTTWNDQGKQLVKKLVLGITVGRSSVVSAVTKITTAAKTAIRNQYSQFYQAGQYVATGFALGMYNKKNYIEEKAKQLAKAALEEMKEELDEQSPSKETMEIGAYAAEGFAIGLGSYNDRIENTAADMASTAVNTTRSAMTTILEALSSDVDMQPTIRPVVDLSDVQTGTNAIQSMFGGIQTLGVRSNLNAINASMNAKLQNGANDDIIEAIDKLSEGLENSRGDTYNLAGVTYDDGSNVSEAISTLVRYARIGRRV